MSNPKMNQAYNIGVLHTQLKNIKEDLVMGNHKDALTRVNELEKFVNNEIAPQFYQEIENGTETSETEKN